MEVPQDTPSNTEAASAAAPVEPQQQQQPAAGSHSESSAYPPLAEPSIRGDAQGSQVSGYLRRRINEEQFDAFCIDCQENRSTHCIVTFGIFVCARCAEIHEGHFSPYQSYIKTLFDDAWDTFQITCVQVGGNKRFFEFLRTYGKERDPINKKYDSSAAHFYRRELCAQAKRIPFNEAPPAKDAREFATKAIDKTGVFFTETNEKYKVSEKAEHAAEATKQGFMSLWGKAKALVKKNPDGANTAAEHQAEEAKNEEPQHQ